MELRNGWDNESYIHWICYLFRFTTYTTGKTTEYVSNNGCVVIRFTCWALCIAIFGNPSGEVHRLVNNTLIKRKEKEQ